MEHGENIKNNSIAHNRIHMIERNFKYPWHWRFHRWPLEVDTGKKNTHLLSYHWPESKGRAHAVTWWRQSDRLEQVPFWDHSHGYPLALLLKMGKCSIKHCPKVRGKSGLTFFRIKKARWVQQHEHMVFQQSCQASSYVHSRALYIRSAPWLCLYRKIVTLIRIILNLSVHFLMKGRMEYVIA